MLEYSPCRACESTRGAGIALSPRCTHVEVYVAHGTLVSVVQSQQGEGEAHLIPAVPPPDCSVNDEERNAAHTKAPPEEDPSDRHQYDERRSGWQAERSEDSSKHRVLLSRLQARRA